MLSWLSLFRLSLTNQPTILEHICSVVKFILPGTHAGEMSGPLKWKGLCQTGTRQSPVNLAVGTASLKVAADMGDFDFAYGTLEKTDVLNTGHGTMQVGNLQSFLSLNRQPVG